MSQQPRRLHRSDCDVWDLPAADAAGSLQPSTGLDPETDRYLAEIAPAYERLGRVMAQLGGIFLLTLTRDGTGAGLHLDHAMYSVARTQLAEARDTIRAARPPATARRHHAGLSDLDDHLGEAADGMDRAAASRGVADTDRRDILRRLAAAQRLLVACAEPDVGMTPVDFENACCNCGLTRGVGG